LLFILNLVAWNLVAWNLEAWNLGAGRIVAIAGIVAITTGL
jgi:hypothetical protein